MHALEGVSPVGVPSRVQDGQDRKMQGWGVWMPGVGGAGNVRAEATGGKVRQALKEKGAVSHPSRVIEVPLPAAAVGGRFAPLAVLSSTSSPSSPQLT